MLNMLLSNLPSLLTYFGMSLLINTLVIWFVLNRLMGSRGTASWRKCLVCAMLVPLAFFIGSIALKCVSFFSPGLGGFAHRISILTFAFLAIGGWIFSVAIDATSRAGMSIYAVVLILNFGIYHMLGMAQLDPSHIAAQVSNVGAKQNDSYEQYVIDFKQALVANLETKYNVALVPEDSGDAEYTVKMFDGRWVVNGQLKSLYQVLPHVRPEQFVKDIDKTMSLMSKVDTYDSVALLDFPRYAVGKDKTEVPIIYFLNIDQDVATPVAVKFAETMLPRVTPDAATVARLLDWHSSGAIDGATTPTTMVDYSAWDLALSEKDLTAFQGHLSMTPEKREDHRKEPAVNGTQPNRLRTMIERTLISAYGNINIEVEVHTDPRTPAQDYFSNKLNYPCEFRKTSYGMGALLPALTRGGDQYVAVEQIMMPAGGRLNWKMEGFLGNVWFRITAPVLADPAKNNELLRLLPMQKLKIAQITGQV